LIERTTQGRSLGAGIFGNGGSDDEEVTMEKVEASLDDEEFFDAVEHHEVCHCVLLHRLVRSCFVEGGALLLLLKLLYKFIANAYENLRRNTSWN
jgi:hypothetical protein